MTERNRPPRLLAMVGLVRLHAKPVILYNVCLPSEVMRTIVHVLVTLLFCPKIHESNFL